MCGDIWTFLGDVRGRIFRYWVYRRMFTPHEQDEKYIDETCYEDTLANLGVIRECVQLPDGDLLLGFQAVSDTGAPEDWPQYIAYYKRSEIRLEYWPSDQEGLSDADE